ncbi:MAG: AMP-binding protein, partial [Nonomuraea sp.]|nr:AMP-binding protein [Nonomuraea sp.]
MAVPRTRRPPVSTIHGLIREHAAVRPGAVALAHRGVHVTYGELDRLSDAYAARLHAAGVRQGDFVPVRLPRSVPLVTTLLGVLKLGAAYALMDGDWPAERVRDEIEQLGSALLVADAPVDGLAGVRLLSPPYGIDLGEPVGPPGVEVGEDDP